MNQTLEIVVTLLGILGFSLAFVAISLAVVFQSVVLLGIVPPDSSDQQRAQYAANWSWFVSAVGALTYVLCTILASNASRPSYSSSRPNNGYYADPSYFSSSSHPYGYYTDSSYFSGSSRPSTSSHTRPPPSHSSTSHDSEENIRVTNNVDLPARRNALRLFGLHEGVTKKNITRAYKKLSLKAHPNRGGTDAKFQALQKAYTVLKKGA